MGLTFRLGQVPLAIFTDSSNNVGIGGAANASFKLQVTGTTNLTGALTGVASTFLGKLTVGSSSLAEGEIGIFETGGNYNFTTFKNGTVRTIIGSQSSTSQGFLGTASNHDLLIKTNDTTRLTIASTGAATFSSSVTATGLNLTTGGSTGATFTSSGTNVYTSLSFFNTTTNYGYDIGFGGSASIAPNSFYIYGGSTASVKLQITSAGDVGIGNGGFSSTRLTVTGKSNTGSDYSFVANNASNGNLFWVRNDGVINTGTSSGSPYNNTSANVANLYVSAGGTLERGTASSMRFKENILEWDGNGLNTILALKPTTFTYKESYFKHPERVMLGLIAEEVAEVCPYLADYENEDGSGQVENVRYATIVVPLIKAIQELEARIKQLENK